jgi:hypothetical protein
MAARPCTAIAAQNRPALGLRIKGLLYIRGVLDIALRLGCIVAGCIFLLAT